MISEGWIAETIREAVRDITGSDAQCHFRYNINVDAIRFTCGPYVFNVNPDAYKDMTVAAAKSTILADIVVPELCPYGY